MAGATLPNSPLSRRRSGSVWPTRQSACSRGYTRSSSRGQTRIRGLTTKVHYCNTSRYLIITDPRFSVLTWVSIYWFSRAGPAASIRIYYETAHAEKSPRFPKTSVPVGLSFFPKELVHFPRVCVPTIPSSGLFLCWTNEGCESSLLRAQAKIVFESEHKVGGHFAAYEQPEALVSDLRKMFGKSGPAAGVVLGSSGY
jgi:hypothetical protein